MNPQFLTQFDFGQDCQLAYKSFTHWQLHDLLQNELKSYWHVTMYQDYMVLTVFHNVEQEVLKIRELVKEAGFTARRAGLLSKNIIVEKI